MSNANKIARYITTIDSAPSYSINILVFKPMTVAATFFFFIHTLLLIIELITNSFYLTSFYYTVKTIRMFILADHHKSIATFRPNHFGSIVKSYNMY